MLVIFDMVGTLFSLDKTYRAFRDEAIPESVMEIWFARLLQTSMTGTMIGKYILFDEAAQSSLTQVLVSHGFISDSSMPILESLQELDPWDDTLHCLNTLREEGHRLAVLTNSSREMTAALLNKAGLDGFFEATFSCDDIGACKPHPLPYRTVVEKIKSWPEEACLVAAHGWDVAGADAAGIRSIWISRFEKSWPFPGSPPGASVANLAEVPSVLFQQLDVTTQP
jgi:2-haloacid dehalogenase